MFTESTTHFKLPQYQDSDTPAFLTDFNNAFETVDNVLIEASQKSFQADVTSSAVAAELSDVSKTVTALDEDSKSVRDALNVTDSNVSDLENRIQSLEEIKPSITDTNAATKEEFALQKQKSDTNKTTIDTNTKNVQSLQQSITALQKQCETFQSHINAMKKNFGLS